MMVFFFYISQVGNSIFINVNVPIKGDAKIYLISKNSTITHFATCNGNLKLKILNIPKGDYNLLVCVFSNNNLIAKSLKIPLSFSYFTKIKVQYRKFDYIK